MLAKKNPTTTKSWQNLQRHYETAKDIHMRDLFADDPRRFDKFSTQFNDILVDYSKNRITEETIKNLIALAEECDLKKAIGQMFAGKKINETENRAVLHIALRNRENTPVMVDGQDVMPQINAVLKQIEDFSNRVISGGWQGYTGKKITDIVNIGIGGSDLGPLMVTEALRPYAQSNMRVHFVSNVDGTHITETSPVILWPFQPTARRSKNSESTKTTCLFSGTGWADAIRCGRPSGCRSPAISDMKTSPLFYRAPLIWISISNLRLLNKTSR